MKEIGAQINRKNWNDCVMVLFFALMTAASIAVLVHPPSLIAVTAIFLVGNFISWAISARGMAVSSEYESMAQKSAQEKLIHSNPALSGIQKSLEKIRSKLPNEKKFWIMAAVNLLAIGAITAALVLNPEQGLQFMGTVVSIGVFTIFQFAMQNRVIRENIAELATVIDENITQKILGLTGETFKRKDLETFDKKSKELILSKAKHLSVDQQLKLAEKLNMDLSTIEFYLTRTDQKLSEKISFEEAMKLRDDPKVENALIGAIANRFYQKIEENPQVFLESLTEVKADFPIIFRSA
jgi:hypothetical protein